MNIFCKSEAEKRSNTSVLQEMRQEKTENIICKAWRSDSRLPKIEI